MNFSDSFFENSNSIQIANKFEALNDQKNNVKPSSVPPKYNHRLTHSKIKLMSININGIRGKKLELSSFLEIEDPDIIAIQETKIDRNILTSELLPDNFNYDVYRNDRTLNGGGVILLVNKTYNSMPLYNLENGSELVWAKIIFDGSPHFFGCWYQDHESPSDHIQLLDDQLIGGLNNTKKITKYTPYGGL
jgi:hypothetical protein